MNRLENGCADRPQTGIPRPGKPTDTTEIEAFNGRFRAVA